MADNKRIRLLMRPNSERAGVFFSIEHNVPARGGNAAQKREHDKKLGAGTMSRSGAQCPCCQAIMAPSDIRYESRSGRLGQIMTTVVVDGLKGKEYRLPTKHERHVADVTEESVTKLFERIPFGAPTEAIPAGSSRKGGGSAFTVVLFGFDQWEKLFTNRQLVTLGCLQGAYGKVMGCSMLITEHPTGQKPSQRCLSAASTAYWILLRTRFPG